MLCLFYHITTLGGDPLSALVSLNGTCNYGDDVGYCNRVLHPPLTTLTKRKQTEASNKSIQISVVAVVCCCFYFYFSSIVEQNIMTQVQVM